MGAVMGSKNLKAIAVRGNAPPDMETGRSSWSFPAGWAELQDQDQFLAARTGAAMDYYEASGNLPIRNFAAAGSPSGGDYSQSMYKKGYVEKMDSCYGCPVRCKKKVRLDQPGRWTPSMEGRSMRPWGLRVCCGIARSRPLSRRMSSAAVMEWTRSPRSHDFLRHGVL